MGEAQNAKPRLLHVEDDARVAGAVSRVLWSHFAVTHVESASSAIETARPSAARIEAAFIDVYLPDGSGIDLAERLRRRQPTLAIALTSSADVADEAASRHFPFFSKPYGSMKLTEWASGVCSRLPQKRVRRGLEQIARSFATLTESELENLRLACLHAADGNAVTPLSKRAIADARGKSEDTIKTQVASALTKTNTKSWVELIARVLQDGELERNALL